MSVWGLLPILLSFRVVNVEKFVILFVCFVEVFSIVHNARFLLCGLCGRYTELAGAHSVLVSLAPFTGFCLVW